MITTLQGQTMEKTGISMGIFIIKNVPVKNLRPPSAFTGGQIEMVITLKSARHSLDKMATNKQSNAFLKKEM